MKSYKKLGFLLAILLLIVGSFFVFNTSRANQVPIDNVVCGTSSAPLLCSGYIILNKGDYNPNEHIGAELWITSMGTYLMGGAPGGPSEATFSGVLGAATGGCTPQNLPCKAWTTEGKNVNAASSPGCYSLSVWYKWPADPNGGPYEYVTPVPYTVGGANCGGSGGPGGGTPPVPPVSLNGSPNPISFSQTLTLSWGSNAGGLTSCDLYDYRNENWVQILDDAPIPGSTQIVYNNPSQAGFHYYEVQCQSAFSSLPIQHKFGLNILKNLLGIASVKAEEGQPETVSTAGTTVEFLNPLNVEITPENSSTTVGAATQFSVNHSNATSCTISTTPVLSDINGANCMGNGSFYTVITTPDAANTYAITATVTNGSGTDADISTLVVQNAPDLTALASTPTTAVVNESVTLQADIKNIGTAATGNGFPAFFQITDTEPSGQITKNFNLINKAYALVGIIDLPHMMVPALNPNGVQTLNNPYTFTQSGVRWVRACADKYNRNTNHTTTPPDRVNEGTDISFEENNNCGPWVAVTIAPPGPQPDLTAGSVTPTTATANSQINLSAQILNQGPVSTGAGKTFYNFIQVLDHNPNTSGGGNSSFLERTKNYIGKIFSSKAEVAEAAGNTGGGTIMSCLGTLPAKPLTEMQGGGQAPITYQCVFSAPGTYYARACADKSNPSTVPPANVSESNELNNCGASWTPIVVGTGAGTGPNLKAGVPTTNHMITPNSPVTFNSVISNVGNEGTGISFKNFAQVATGPNGTGVSIDVPTGGSLMSALPAGGTGNFSLTHTFNSAGTIYARVCADKSNHTTPYPGMVLETDEDDNCSAWTQFVIGNPSTTTGDLIPDSSSCVIPLGGSNCQMHFTWSVTNPTGATIVTQEMVGTVGTGNPGSGKFDIPYNSSTFHLYNDGVELDLETITSSCAVKTVWDGKACVDQATKIDGSCSATHYGCIAGNSSNWQGNSQTGWTWQCVGSGGGATANCSEAGNGNPPEEKCANGATNYPLCTIGEDGKCLNGATNPPICDTDPEGMCINPKATNFGKPAPCVYRKVIKWFER